MRVTKAHAYGNDFLLVPVVETAGGDVPALARATCHRHQGIGADGLIVYELRPSAAAMTLHNADGSRAELSGNGLRCLAAVVVRTQQLHASATIEVDTDAGRKALELISVERGRYLFRAALGPPTGLRHVEIDAAGEVVRAAVLGMGNPQCVVLGPLPERSRFERLGRALATHPMFPAGTNVEFAEVEASDRVRILIWERGVGPTASSGTGTSASAVAAAAYGGAARAVTVVAPGGAQQVEWRDEGVYLTGWAEIVFEGTWMAPAPDAVRS